MHRFKFLWDPIGHPSLFIPFYLVTLNHLGSFAIALHGFWDNISLYPCSNYVVILFMFMSRPLILIGTWRLTWETRATTRVEWDTLGWLIRKASGRLPYLKGARAVGDCMQRGSRVDFAAMTVRRGILASALPINCSGFSEASGTL